MKNDNELPEGSFRSGKGYSVQIGQINKKWQICLGTRGKKGNDMRGKMPALAYAMFCLCCGYFYGANEGDVHHHKCPKCGDGKPGICYDL